MDKKIRIEWIDVAKGYGIILVIMGHCFNKDTLIHNWIFSFHMPLFFILSGYCFSYSKYDGVLDVIRDKGRTLIKPYIQFCILGCIVSLMIPEWRKSFSMTQVFVDIYCAYPTLTNITSTWYLVALFNLSVLLYLVIWFSKRYHLKWFAYLFVILSGCGGFLITVIRKLFFMNPVSNGGSKGLSLPGGRLPLTLDTCMTALVFFALGYYFRNIYKKRERIEKQKGIYGLICFAINLIFALGLNSRVNLHGCTYGNVIYFYIAAVSGSFAVFLFAQIIVCKYNYVKNILIFYGRNSLFILGIQSLFVHLYVYCINRATGMNYILYENVPFKYGWYMFIVITFAAIPILCVVKNRIKKKVMVRK